MGGLLLALLGLPFLGDEGGGFVAGEVEAPARPALVAPPRAAEGRPAELTWPPPVAAVAPERVAVALGDASAPRDDLDELLALAGGAGLDKLLRPSGLSGDMLDPARPSGGDSSGGSGAPSAPLSPGAAPAGSPEPAAGLPILRGGPAGGEEGGEGGGGGEGGPLGPESTPVVTVTASDAEASEVGPDGGVFTFQRTGDVSAALEVAFTVGGSADSGADYTGLPETLVVVFGPGQATVDVPITPETDGWMEGPETAVVTLAPAAVGEYTVGTPDSATVTIYDEPAVAVAASDMWAEEPASGAGTETGEFLFVRTESRTALTLNYTVSGAATNGVDYQALSGSVTFGVGVAEVAVAVVPLGDELAEGPEEVTVTLLPVSGYAQPGATQATVTIADYDRPNVFDDKYSVKHDTTLSVPADEGVLSNDIALSGGPVGNATLISGVSHGTLTLAADGSFTYAPTAGYVGADSFVYSASNSAGSGTATVTIDVTNQAPATSSGFFHMRPNVTLTVDAPGLLAWTSDPDDYFPDYVLEDGPAHGSLALNSDGTFSYTPQSGFVGTDEFTYRAFDGAWYSEIGKATIRVINAAPVATGEAYLMAPGGKVTRSAVDGLLSNDYDSDGDVLTAVLVSAPQHAASFTFNADGSFSYTSQSEAPQGDSFAYQVSDGVVSSYPVGVVFEVSDVPVGRTDFYELPSSGSLVVPAAQGVLANDFNPVGGGLEAVLTTAPGTGSLTLNADGSFTFTPAGGQSVWFEYSARASNGAASVPQLVAIGVDPSAASLTSLTFLDGETMTPDDGPEAPQQARWVEGGVADPVAYQVGSMLNVQAVFSMNQPPSRLANGAQVRGTGGGLTLAGTAKLDRYNQLVLAKASVQLPSMVDYFEPLVIQWEALLPDATGALVWKPAGASANRLYLTVGPPPKDKRWDTVVAVATRAIKGKTTRDDKILAIWNVFAAPTGANAGKPPEVKRVSDNSILRYYGSWFVTDEIRAQRLYKKNVLFVWPEAGDSEQTTASLLKFSDGDCVAWTRFLLDVLFAADLPTANNFYIVKSTRAKPDSVLVKNWKKVIAGNGSNRDKETEEDYKLINTFFSSSSIPFQEREDSEAPLRSYVYSWDEKGSKKEFTDDKGIAGQGNPEPRSQFENHVVARLTVGIETLLFDPSYGRTWADITDLDNNLVDYYARLISTDPNDTRSKAVVARVNPPALDLQRNPEQKSHEYKAGRIY